MPEPMSDERLAEHRAMRDQTRGWGPEEVDTVWDFHAEAVDEIDHLRAEVERLLRENLELRMIPVFEEHRS